MLNIQTFTVNPLGENCYVVSDETGNALVIDNGAVYSDEWETIDNYFSEKGLTPVGQILTHAHFDHIFGTGKFFETHGAKVCFHAEDADLYYNLSTQLKTMMGIDLQMTVAPLEHYVKEGDKITFGNHSLKVIHTPGHSKGGVCYYCEEEKVLFCGDTLFKGSIGRTDLKGGDFETLINSIQKKILVLPSDVTIYPGHGHFTSVEEEKMNNPYIY